MISGQSGWTVRSGLNSQSNLNFKIDHFLFIFLIQYRNSSLIVYISMKHTFSNLYVLRLISTYIYGVIILSICVMVKIDQLSSYILTHFSSVIREKLVNFGKP